MLIVDIIILNKLVASNSNANTNYEYMVDITVTNITYNFYKLVMIS